MILMWLRKAHCSVSQLIEGGNSILRFIMQLNMIECTKWYPSVIGEKGNSLIRSLMEYRNLNDNIGCELNKINWNHVFIDIDI